MESNERESAQHADILQIQPTQAMKQAVKQLTIQATNNRVWGAERR